MILSNRIFTWAAALLTGAFAQTSGAITIDSWRFTSGIHDLAPGAPDNQEFVAFETVENPFQDSHSVTLGSSNISSAYDISWLVHEAQFNITTSQYLRELDGDTSASGRIYLTPSVDSVINFSGNWQYAWPGSVIGATTFGAGVYDYETQEELATFVGQGGNVGLDPPFGAFNLSASTNLTAGREYLLIYRAQVFHFDPTPPGTFGEASGDFHFTITPIPEPAAAMLLALPFLAMRPRRLP